MLSRLGHSTFNERGEPAEGVELLKGRLNPKLTPEDEDQIYHVEAVEQQATPEGGLRAHRGELPTELLGEDVLETV